MNWDVFYLKTDKPSKIAVDILNNLKKHFTKIEINILEDDIFKTKVSNGLFYIGHGDQLGVFRSIDFDTELFDHLLTKSSISNINQTPLVFWACFSAKWCESSNRKDWFGFKNIIGYDLSRKEEEIWWKDYIQNFFILLIKCANNEIKRVEIENFLDCKYKEVLFSKNKKRSNFTILATKAFLESSTFGEEYGK